MGEWPVVHLKMKGYPLSLSPELTDALIACASIDRIRNEIAAQYALWWTEREFNAAT